GQGGRATGQELVDQLQGERKLLRPLGKELLHQPVSVVNGGPREGPPPPPDVRSGPAEPCRSSVTVIVGRCDYPYSVPCGRPYSVCRVTTRTQAGVTTRLPWPPGPKT